ncbi:extracellular solute-binding protein [Pseudoruegeria sp. SK021]|uniref:extracellular solute-binding protein n=1 Tax=Pseudoruegeria sp. SK021 TaxID=1933035 RepID=UPI001F0B6B90|nr:extracellular solute-binding protein [Pseudoruegeria sp. SK021]
MRSSAAIALSLTVLGVPAPQAMAQEIDFWAQDYGDLIAWQRTMKTFADEFKAESGIKVNYEQISWSVAFNRWLTAAQGGAAPDCADMFWLHSFSAIGGDQYGPMPLNEYRDTWPTLEADFYEGSLQDVNWSGDFYGIPWRGDVRPLIYRKDIAEEAGLEGAPQTWDDLVTFAKAMQGYDANGNVTRWGMALGPDTVTQGYVPFFWQAGGDFMTEDGRTATIDTEATRVALSYIRDLVWEHEVLNPDFMERSYSAEGDFPAGTVAMIASAAGPMAPSLSVDYPELDGKWALAIPAAGPEGRDAYAGSGYLGVLRGSDNVEECVQWISFLSRPENMQRLSEASGNVSPMREVMASEFWGDTDWKQVIQETMEYAHTSQHPTPVWNGLLSPEPGAVIYDMMYRAIVQQEDMDVVIADAQARMQSEMDRAFSE